MATNSEDPTPFTVIVTKPIANQLKDYYGYQPADEGDRFHFSLKELLEFIATWAEDIARYEIDFETLLINDNKVIDLRNQLPERVR